MGNWRRLLTCFGYAQPSEEPVDLRFGSVQVECVSSLGTELSQDDYGTCYMQFSEFGLFAVR